MFLLVQMSTCNIHIFIFSNRFKYQIINQVWFFLYTHTIERKKKIQIYF